MHKQNTFKHSGNAVRKTRKEVIYESSKQTIMRTRKKIAQQMQRPNKNELNQQSDRTSQLASVTVGNSYLRA
jgi:hypothetical protein